ncbi:hypothetical protein B0T22DRAFT_485650 [Podospora appendiculata]|uniref:Uncharacterized protein n=1 Tax=Podospora appendiculata TaxID=314037 RepID=A0AAE0WZ51_9PEZI|nr:hypothetical protein B0T22DRAFT_485650 [Podospora appendiculata]
MAKVSFHHSTQNGMRPAVSLQVVESRTRTPTLPDDESTGELKPADAEPRLEPQSPSGAAPAVGLIHDKGPAAATSLNILITVTMITVTLVTVSTTIKRVTQNNVILSLQTTEERKTMKRALPRRRTHERVWLAHPLCWTTKEITTMSWPVVTTLIDHGTPSR